MAASAAFKLSRPEPRAFREVPVLYEDDHLVALDKPARLLTSPPTTATRTVPT